MALLQGMANAVAGVAHTKSKDTSYLLDLGMDSVEVPTFTPTSIPTSAPSSWASAARRRAGAALPYIVNPTVVPVPDLAFLSYFLLSPIYFEKWNTLTDAGLHVTGTAAATLTRTCSR